MAYYFDSSYSDPPSASGQNLDRQFSAISEEYFEAYYSDTSSDEAFGDTLRAFDPAGDLTGDPTELAIDFCSISGSKGEKLTDSLREMLERPNCLLTSLKIEDNSFLLHSESTDGAYEKVRKCRLAVIAALGTSKSLTQFSIEKPTREEVRELCNSLAANTGLEELYLYFFSTLEDEDASILSSMLGNNRTLKTFGLWSNGISPVGATFLGAMLTDNSFLENLDVTGNNMKRDGIEKLMTPLMESEDGLQRNHSLKCLVIDGNRMGGTGGAGVVSQTLRTNKKLVHFSMRFSSLKEDEACDILKSLEKNRTLQELDISNCEGFDTEKVSAVFLDVLACNYTLKTINFRGSDIAAEAAILFKLESNECMIDSYKAALLDLPKRTPMFARVFLCGDSMAGKSSLRISMTHSLATNFGEKARLLMVEPCKTMMHCLQALLDPEELASRTRGIKIRLLSKEDNLVISIWDLAGQEEYQAFHDFMIPNSSDRGSSSGFLLLCSPFIGGSCKAKDILEIEKELSYWMKFIASNTQRSKIAQPHVTVVITHKDKGYKHIELIKQLVIKLKQQFSVYVEVSAQVHFVNATDYQSGEVKFLAQEIQKTFSERLGRLPEVYEACVTLQCAVSKWNQSFPYEPLIDKTQFNGLYGSLAPGLPVSNSFHGKFSAGGIQRPYPCMKRVRSYTLKRSHIWL